MYLSNEMPELTAQEIKFMGSYVIGYHDSDIGSDIATKGSFDKFYHHAGIIGKDRQDLAKSLAYDLGSLTVFNTTTGHKATIYVWSDNNG